MDLYRRDDGAICKAIQFMGSTEDFMENRFEVMDYLLKADLRPEWVAEEVTDEWVENEAGDDYEQVVIPEHFKLWMSEDEVKVGDYVVLRADDTYVMDGQMFEAIWERVFDDSPELTAGESTRVKLADICKNCGKSIANFDTDGNIFDDFRHSEGINKNLIACSIWDTLGKEGFKAEPRPGNTPKEITND